MIVRFKCRSAISKLCRDRLVLSDEAVRLISDEIDSVDREQYEATLDAMVSAIESRDYETKHHCRRVQVYAVQLGRRLGLSAEQLLLLLALGLVRIVVRDDDRVVRQPEAPVDDFDYLEWSPHFAIG